MMIKLTTKLMIYNLSLGEVCLEGEQMTLEDFSYQIYDGRRGQSRYEFQSDLDEVTVAFGIDSLSSEVFSLRYAVFIVNNADRVVIETTGGETRQVLSYNTFVIFFC